MSIFGSKKKKTGSTKSFLSNRKLEAGEYEKVDASEGGNDLDDHSKQTAKPRRSSFFASKQTREEKAAASKSFSAKLTEEKEKKSPVRSDNWDGVIIYQLPLTHPIPQEAAEFAIKNAEFLLKVMAILHVRFYSSG